MNQVKKTFLVAAASLGLISCERKLTKVYKMDEQGAVAVDSFMTEYPEHMVIHSSYGEKSVRDTAGIHHNLKPGTFKFERPVPGK